MEITKEDTKDFSSGTKQTSKMTKKEQERQYIEWRRSKILELKAQGYTTERELASKLNVSDSTIHSDFVFLREQARESFNTHIQDRLPSEYERCITGMNQVLKMSWDIANGSNGANNVNGNGESITATFDNKTRLQALSLVNDCYKYIMDLTTNGVVITDAIKFVQTNKEKLTMSRKEDNGNKESGGPDYDEDKNQLEEQEEKEELNQEATNTIF